ncbi:MAG TPA: YdeI/OmpD-associated family protein [Chitinophagaceae bacterium]|nr:YdeI/OmpD-associated family protein [Chitinophagaceae bacterium]
MANKTTKENYKTFHPKTRQAWRKWLEKNHSISPGIWLIYDKKSTGRAKLVYNDAVEEALCFGWIDSTMRPLDGERFMQRFTPRKPKSGWSGLNKKRIEKMIAEGLMASAGLEKIDLAKKDGSWESLDYIDAIRLPEDFEKALSKNKKARVNFENFPPFSKKQFLYHINQAKTEVTRKQRIRLCVKMAAANKKPSVGGFKL